MGSNCRFCRKFVIISRKLGTKPKVKVKLEEKVQQDIESSMLTAKKHPGIIKVNNIEIPLNILDSIKLVLKDQTVKDLQTKGEILYQYLCARHPPVENNEVYSKKQEFEEEAKNTFAANFTLLNDNEKEYINKRINHYVERKLKANLYHWKPIDFNFHQSSVYLVSRAAANYAAVYKIFMEMKLKLPDYKPTTLFDFGSGVGTVSWAANSVWTNSLREYFNVDISKDMNDIASLILRNGNDDKPVPRGVYYRQFLPSSHLVKYDIVVSAYSLFELPSAEARLDVLHNLWSKTQHFLVLVEMGTNAGFKMLNEARDFILQIDKNYKVPVSPAHMFAPCPHDAACPRLLEDDTPCNFEVRYFPFTHSAKKELRKERFSFVVIKKGARSSDDPQWPRIVRPTLVRKKHTICRMCVSSGKLQEVIFTAAKHGKITYHCARASSWGDSLPVSITQNEAEGMT